MALSKRRLALPLMEIEQTEARPVRCSRCDGFMVLTRYEDWGSTTNSQTLLAWNCLQCGEVIDPVILANRRKSAVPVIGKNRKPILSRRS